MKKRVFVAVLAVIILFCSVPSYAQEEALVKVKPIIQAQRGGMMIEGSLSYPYPKIGFFALTQPMSDETKQELYELLYVGIINHTGTIDISALNIPVTQFNTEVMDIYTKVLFENPELMAYTYLRGNEDENGAYIKNLLPSYLFSTKAEDEAAQALVEEGIDYFTNLAAGVPDTLGKILVVHDEFTKKFEYDHEGLATFNEYFAQNAATAEHWQIRTAYGLFKNNKAVCQGNAIVLAEIYNRLGIETSFCSSKLLNHIWNIVKLDGKWYHLDITSDDATITYKGENRKGAFHNFFLLSSETNAARGNSKDGVIDWVYTTDAEVLCDDKTYEDGYIYTGDYIYGGQNYGSWYGNVSYENGRYAINIDMLPQYSQDDGAVYFYIGARPTLYSKTIESKGAIASDIYTATVINAQGVEQNVDTITYFMNKQTQNATVIVADYEGDELSRVVPRDFTITSGGLFKISLPTYCDKVLLWKEGFVLPLCEARER